MYWTTLTPLTADRAWDPLAEEVVVLVVKAEGGAKAGKVVHRHRSDRAIPFASQSVRAELVEARAGAGPRLHAAVVLSLALCSLMVRPAEAADLKMVTGGLTSQPPASPMPR